MKLKLFNKYFFTTASIIIFSFAIMIIILSVVLNSYISKSQQTTLNIACEEIFTYVTDKSGPEASISQDEFYTVLKSVSNVGEADIFIADRDYKIIACGCEKPQNGDNCHHSSVIISKEELKSSENGAELHLGTLGIYQNPHYIIHKDITGTNGTAYATVFATAPVSLVSNLLSTVTKLFLTSALLPLILMFLFIYAMTYRLTKPLKLMSIAAKAMAKGDFSKRIPVMSDDEIGELSVSFNMMTNSLSQLEGMRKSFVADVSHELKTPMTTISGFIDGILDGTIEKERQNYYLKIVSDEVKRLSRLVESMLNMAKLESGEFIIKPELFDFAQLVCSIVLAQEQRIENLKLNIIGLDTMENVSVNADRDLIHQVVYNLVDNAVKFNCENGSIDFTLKREGKYLVFTISNTGEGIPEKDLPYVFERFYKVDKSRSNVKNSTGLGLYLVKSIITAHSGTISVIGGEKTTFKVTLPI